MRLALLLVACAACSAKSGRKRSDDAGPAVRVVTVILDAGAAGSTGPTSDEIEPNDGEDTATPLPIGGTVRGSLASETDVDEYRIDVAQAGALALALPGIDGVDLTLELEDQGGTVLAKSDRSGARVREGIPNFGVTPGRYTAVVRQKKSKKKPGAAAPAASPVYELSASLAAPAAGAEREPDDDRGTANDLIIGDTASGFVGWTGDADAYKLSVETLSGKNAVDFEVSAVEGVALSLELADALGQPLATRKGARGAPLVVRGFVPVVAAGAPPFVYATVKGDRSNPETAYQLAAKAKVIETDAELEPNDTPERAMPVPPDRTTVRASWSTGDVDCFAVAPVANARTLDVTIDTGGDIDLAVELLVDGAVVGKSDHPGKGAAEHVTGPVPANGRAVIRVKGTDAAGEGTYSVVIGESAAAP